VANSGKGRRHPSWAIANLKTTPLLGTFGKKVFFLLFFFGEKVFFCFRKKVFFSGKFFFQCFFSRKKVFFLEFFFSVEFFFLKNVIFAFSGSPCRGLSNALGFEVLSPDPRGTELGVTYLPSAFSSDASYYSMPIYPYPYWVPQSASRLW